MVWVHLSAAKRLEHLHILTPFFVFANPIDTQRMQTSHVSQTLALTPLSLLHLYAKYLRAQFQDKLNSHLFSSSVTLLAQPLMLLVALASELNIIAATLVNAFFNHS